MKSSIKKGAGILADLKGLRVAGIITIFFAITISAFSQTTIYIDPTNSGSNQTGTISNPYNSWNSFTFTNGNTYLQKRGTIFNTSGGLTVTGKSNITIGAYGTGVKPRIISSSSSARIVRLTNSSNCTIRDLEITSTTGILGPIAIGIDGSSSNNLVDSCLLRNCQYGVNMGTTVGAVGNRILRTIIHTTGDDGMYLKDMKTLEVGFCHIYDVNRKYLTNPDQSYSAGDCIQIVGNPNVANALTINIHDNILDHSSMGNKFCLIVVGDHYSGVVENNIMTGTSSTSGMYLWHTTGTITVRKNTVQSANYSIYSYVHDLQVHYNKFINNHLGISVQASALTQTSVTALNNIFYNNTSFCLAANVSSSSIVSRNNTFYISGSSAKAYSSGSSSVTSNNNCFNIQQNGFINSYSTLAAWRAASGDDMNSFVSNPMFVNPSTSDFHIQSGSPCINSGTNVNLITDFYNNAVPQGGTPDVGIHEFSSQGGGNLPPVISNQSFQISENSSNGTAVGTVVASDPNAGQLLSFSITAGNTNNAFSINSTTGIISVVNSQFLNYEISPSFGLTVRATDNGTGNLYAQATITVNLSNVNENPVMANQSFSVAQNAANGTIVGTIVASNPDQGQILAYSIISGNTNGAFALNSATGSLSVANSGAFTQGSFSLSVRATDNGTPVLWTAATISITITTTANQAPVIANQSFNVAANASNGTTIGTVLASDPNSGQTLTYSITAGNTNSVFAIAATSGVLTVANSTGLSQGPFSLTVRVTDNGTPNLYTQASVTISINQPANLPPVIANQSFSITGYAANGTQVGMVIASDPNSGQSLAYSITSGNTNSVFAIQSSTGRLTVANSTSLIPGTFNLSVRVTDNGSPVLYSQASVTITVTQPGNNAPVIANQNFSVVSYAANGILVGTVVATDPNSGQTLTYSIRSGNSSSAFAINSGNGRLTVNNSSALYPRTFSLVVRATDNGNPSLYSQATISITVTQSANHAPVLTASVFNIAQFAPNGQFVGIVSGTDPDPGQSLTFQIISGNTSNAFHLNATNGALNVTNSQALNVNVNPVFYLNVRVTDNGQPSLSSVGVIRVNVIANKQGETSAEIETNDVVQENDFIIYPNPSSDGIFKIKSESFKGIADIHIFEISGKLINRLETSSDFNTIVDLSDQPTGLYFMKISTTEFSHTYKLIKQ